MEGHAELVMSLGHGAVLTALIKQKINTLSSNETETISFLDGMPKNMWCLYFAEAQGLDISQE